MPYNPDGSFTFTYNFGTGTAPDNIFPNQVGQDLNDLATSIDINNIIAQISGLDLDVTFHQGNFDSIVVGSPTGGDKGSGSINAETGYLQGVGLFTLGVSGTGQTLTGGVNEVEYDNGTPTNGSTVTIDPSKGLKQKVTNNVAGFTIAATSQVGDVELRIVNGASAGTITFSGFSKNWTGDPLNTTNTNQFIVFIYGYSSKIAYIIKALQ